MFKFLLGLHQGIHQCRGRHALPRSPHRAFSVRTIYKGFPDNSCFGKSYRVWKDTTFYSLRLGEGIPLSLAYYPLSPSCSPSHSSLHIGVSLALCALPSSLSLLSSLHSSISSLLFSPSLLLTLPQVGVSLALYPLSAFRAANAAALHVYQTILADGTQQAAVTTMQTREELYKFLDYYKYENQLDVLFGQNKQ